MDSPYSQEIKVVISAIQHAAKLSNHVISATDKGIIEKEDLSPVTVADFAIQALLTATIHHSFPNDKFVGEESSADLRNNPALLSRVWELLQRVESDKLPGSLCRTPETVEQTFVEGGLYAINTCLLEGGKQIVGIVGLPNLAIDVKAPIGNHTIDQTGTGSILFAVKDHGTYIRPLPDTPTLPRKLPRHADIVDAGNSTALRSVTCIVGTDSALDGIHEEVASKLGIPFPGNDILAWVVRWVSLALGVASTTFWVYKRRDRYAKIWDHAGAMLLFQEVGGKITDVDGREIEFSIGRKMTGNFGFVAAPSALHGRVLEVVRKAVVADGRIDLLEPRDSS